MHMNHSSFKRVIQLDEMIQKGQFRSVAQAADHFEVSPRTIDLDEMRHQLHADIVYNRKEGRYEYRGKPVTLPAQWLSEKEIAVMLIAEKSLRVFTHASFSDDIHPAFNKLLNPIRDRRETMDNIRELCKSVCFTSSFEPVRGLRTEFSIVLRAILDRRRLSMEYHSPGRAPQVRREIEPYVLINNNGEWQVVGRCRRARSVKTFSLARVHAPRVEDHFFSIPDDFRAEAYLTHEFESLKNSRVEHVVLQVDPPSAAWVRDRMWHRSQTIAGRRNGGVTVALSCQITDSLVRWILQMGSDVTVVSPRVLRESVAKTAGRMVERNA
jgi:predicted DNA-binding transcriptional regulator YafY